MNGLPNVASHEFREALLQSLKENLTIEVHSGGFTEPNERTIQVLFDGNTVAEATFDVVQKSEYEG